MQKFKSVIRNGLAYLAAGLVLAILVSVLQARTAQAQTGEVVIEVPTAPTISIIHNNQILEATTDDAGVNHNSWQYAVFNREPNCQDSNINYVPANINNRRQTVTSANNGQWFCFKVTNADNLTGFAKYQVSGVIDPVSEPVPVSQPEEETGPDPQADFEITVEQDGQTLTASVVSGFQNPQWEVTLIDADADCSADNEEAFANSRRVFASHQVNGLSWRDSGRHYCFRAMEDAQGETKTDYQGIKVSGLERPASAQTGQETTAAPAAPTTPSTPAPETTQPASTTTSTEQGSADQSGEGDNEENEGLRQIGIGIVLLGVLAVIIVMIVSRKQDREAEMAEEEEEEAKSKSKKKKK